MAVRVVTDSTADLPEALARELGITVVPLNVHFGDETLRDGVDIAPDEFYRRLVASPRPPTTSQPSVGLFLDTYSKLLDQGDEIVSIHVSSLVSGTHNSAIQAVQELGPGRPIAVVDSLQASLSLGLPAIAAARAAQSGAGLDEVRSVAEGASSRARLFGLLETLEYLQRGGRIGRAQAWVGTLLRIKPLLTIEDGVAHPLERVRTRSKGVERLGALVRELAPLDDLAVLHADTPDDAAALAERVAESLPGRALTLSQFGPVMGPTWGRARWASPSSARRRLGLEASGGRAGAVRPRCRP